MVHWVRLSQECFDTLVRQHNNKPETVERMDIRGELRVSYTTMDAGLLSMGSGTDFLSALNALLEAALPQSLSWNDAEWLRRVQVCFATARNTVPHVLACLLARGGSLQLQAPPPAAVSASSCGSPAFCCLLRHFLNVAKRLASAASWRLPARRCTR